MDRRPQCAKDQIHPFGEGAARCGMPRDGSHGNCFGRPGRHVPGIQLAQHAACPLGSEAQNNSRPDQGNQDLQCVSACDPPRSQQNAITSSEGGGSSPKGVTRLYQVLPMEVMFVWM